MVIEMNLKLHLRNGEEPITFEEAKIFIPKKEDGVVKHKHIAYFDKLSNAFVEESSYFIFRSENDKRELVIRREDILYIEVLNPLHQCHSDLED